VNCWNTRNRQTTTWLERASVMVRELASSCGQSATKPLQPTATGNAHRPSRKGVGSQGKGYRSAVPATRRMIWSGLAGNCKRGGQTRALRNTTQNIPNAENDKFKIRGAFVPADGYTLIVVDYDTLEMRLLACASQEPSMVQMIRAGKDIHMGNATLVFGDTDGFDYDEIAAAKKTDKKVKNGELPAEAVTERMHHLLRRRLQVKTIGFGLNYGMKEKKLARDLGISVGEATDLMKAYMDRYPAVKGFFDEAVEETRDTGYSFTILGRRRFLGDIIAEDEMTRWGAERRACNTPIQGSAADVVKMAMLRCYYEGDLERRFGCKMLLQVHDELMFECPQETAEEVQPIIKEMMEHSLPTDLDVPLTVSMGIGKSWADTH